MSDPTSIWHVGPVGGGDKNPLGRVYQSPVVDRIADKIVRLPATLMQELGADGLGGVAIPIYKRPNYGDPAAESTAPGVLPMWNADP